ncbi:hypothetical protein RDI58_026787 [Solanum bulbocastanum]|uniref:Uncharacterized protein n=1 Tax=Solanum bulbocastanum TaxID=147425 RepID=A0AAN8SZN4_SOLBU
MRLKRLSLFLDCSQFGVHVCSMPLSSQAYPLCSQSKALQWTDLLVQTLKYQLLRYSVFLASLQYSLFLYIYDCILVPLARATTRKPSGITILQRIGTGIFISILAIVSAAIVVSKLL